jgi:hypothetical protein
MAGQLDHSYQQSTYQLASAMAIATRGSVFREKEDTATTARHPN